MGYAHCRSAIGKTWKNLGKPCKLETCKTFPPRVTGIFACELQLEQPEGLSSDWHWQTVAVTRRGRELPSEPELEGHGLIRLVTPSQISGAIMIIR